MVQTVGFDYEAVESNLDGVNQDGGHRERKAQEEAVIRILQIVCANGATVKEAGRRAILLLHHIRPENKTQADVALHLDITPARVTQILKGLRPIFANVFNDIDRYTPEKIKRRTIGI